MFGSHLSVAGGLHKAVTAAAGLSMQTVQIFTHAPAQWAVKRASSGSAWSATPLSEHVCQRWREAVTAAGFGVTVVHDSYLINLASSEDQLWEKSVAAFAAELSRCEQLRIPYLVTHPGAHQGAGEEVGLSRVIAGLDEVHRRVPKAKTITCLEVTAGQGSSLGWRLEHLARIREGVKQPERLGVCLDTAHLLAAGYDFRGRKYPGFRRELDTVIGIEHVKVWHLNDSKKDLGTRVDRHEHIGHGFVGLEGFRPIVRDAAWEGVPKILETAKETHPDGRPWDTVNLETLLSLRAKRKG